MKGIRFYAEYDSPKAKRDNDPSPENCIAIFVNNKGQAEAFYSGKYACYECACGLLDQANSPVCSSSIPIHILSKYYKRISEAKARKIHPLLFRYLEA